MENSRAQRLSEAQRDKAPGGRARRWQAERDHGRRWFRSLALRCKLLRGERRGGTKRRRYESKIRIQERGFCAQMVGSLSVRDCGVHYSLIFQIHARASGAAAGSYRKASGVGPAGRRIFRSGVFQVWAEQRHERWVSSIRRAAGGLFARGNRREYRRHCTSLQNAWPRWIHRRWTKRARPTANWC